jgi:DNA-binding CsgD family transcriptional regulator
MRKARALSKNHSKATLVGQPLTARESEVLWLVTEGLSNKTIADRLNLSPHTIKFHLRNAGKKIGATSRTKAAVNFALQQGDAARTRGTRPSTRSEFAEHRDKLLVSANWIHGFAAALAQVHRHGGGSTVVREAARDAGLTLATARDAGVSSSDLKELESAKIP